MTLTPLPIATNNKNYDSKKSREAILNLLPETDGENYYTLRQVPGLTLFSTLTESPTRSNGLVNDDFLYMVSGDNLYRVDEFGSFTDLGVVGGSPNRAFIMANSSPGDSQIFVQNGIGQGFIYTNALGTATEVTDPDFLSAIGGGDVLNERFWFPRSNTNEFFGSDTGDGFDYSPLSFASAENAPDKVVRVVQKKSAIWVCGTKTMEYWQSRDNATLPVRRVNGATKQRGVIAVDSLASAGEVFCWFADDLTVRMIEGSTMSKISSLDFELKVRGNGTLTFPGFSVVDDAIGFFIDGPVHKIFYLTFPTEGYTWGYDFASGGLTHERTSEGVGFWRIGSATLFNTKLIGGDLLNGNLYVLDQANATENGATLRQQFVTPSISRPKNFTVPYIELDMEVATTNDPNLVPLMRCEYSKDGGNTWTIHSNISIGKFGEHQIRVPLRRFGRVLRNKDLVFRFTVTDAVRCQFYGLMAEINMDA